jgi:hypothetical protein
MRKRGARMHSRDQPQGRRASEVTWPEKSRSCGAPPVACRGRAFSAATRRRCQSPAVKGTCEGGGWRRGVG